MIRHPGRPFVREFLKTDELYQLGFEYVDQMRSAMRLSQRWVSGLREPPLKKWTATATKLPPDDSIVFRWFPFDKADPRNSFIAKRRVGDGSKDDESGILLAALCLNNPSADQVYLSGLRLRVVFHLSKPNGKRQVRFTGMSRSHGEPEAIELEGRAYLKKEKPPDGKKAEAVHAEVFPQDPPSKGGVGKIIPWRPNRSSDELQPAQAKMLLGDLPMTGNRATLKDENVEVLNSPLVDRVADLGLAKEVEVKMVAGERRVKETRARTNDFAAVNAYYHGRSLFKRMTAYGFDLPTYFRCAVRPVYIHYRGILRRYGRVRNAEVVWDSDPPPNIADGIPGRILVRFGLADLSMSPLNFPLGMACDVRWSWHEFGHVLLMGSVGEREFRFAHSAGDAMAAILADPDSELGLPVHDAGWRGVTFPWVTLTRRHDRKPDQGWAWGGILDRGEQGYWKEQILSSTLFRLYQALGGNKTSGGQRDKLARRAAADYTTFLVMQAIGLLGAAAIVPASTPDQFVSALMDADIGTSRFLAPDLSLDAFAASPPRIGGTGYKVVRWAFEQQGLYAEPGWPVSGPGEPELVDIYIASNLNGGYAADLATYDIVVNNPVANQANPVSIRICNRGKNQANGVKVALWATQLNVDGSVPAWKDPGWVSAALAEQDTTIPGRDDGGTAGVQLQFQWAPPTGGDYALLVDATCDDDRANTRAETALPCALNGAPIHYLVTGDNNLGLKALVKVT